MSKEISVDLRAIRMMSGITIWIEAEKVKRLEEMLKTPRSEWPTLLKIGDELVAPYSIEGVYTPATMDSDQRRKNGQWQCKTGKWHDRGERCDCAAEKARNERYRRGAEITAPDCADPKLKRECTGCTDKKSEGTHQGCTKQHGHVGCKISFKQI